MECQKSKRSYDRRVFAQLTYKDGIKELYPDFLLTAPSFIHIQILHLYADALNSKYAANHDAAAGVLPSSNRSKWFNNYIDT